VFRQALRNLVYGISLYYDLASLADDLKVKPETLASAREPYKNTKASVEEGTPAAVELTRAQAKVAGAEQDVINAEGSLEEEEAILKDAPTRKGIREPALESARLIVTDTLSVPPEDRLPSLSDLVEQAAKLRPNLIIANFGIKNFQIALEGTKNELLPSWTWWERFRARG
jgi:outer membrane protein